MKGKFWLLSRHTLNLLSPDTNYQQKRTWIGHNISGPCQDILALTDYTALCPPVQTFNFPTF